MIAPVAEDMNGLNDAPPLQFPEAGADVGASHGKGIGDFFGIEGPGREIEESVDLSDRAVDTRSAGQRDVRDDGILFGWLTGLSALHASAGV